MTTQIALVGDHNDAYPSHRELNAVRGVLGDGVEATWMPTDSLQVHDLATFDHLGPGNATCPSLERAVDCSTRWYS